MPIRPDNPSVDTAVQQANRQAALAHTAKIIAGREGRAGDNAYIAELQARGLDDLINSQKITPEEYDGFVSSLNEGSRRGSDPSDGRLVTVADPTSPSGTRSYAGVNAGITLDPNAYGTTPAQQAAYEEAVNRQRATGGRDPNRFYIDRAAIDDVQSRNASFEAPEIDTVKNGRGYFSGTDAALADARGFLDNTRVNTAQQEATALFREAAQGNAPSQADAMYQQAGADAQRSYKQAGYDADVRTRNGSNAVLAAQSALAAGARGNVSGLARLQAQNNAAMGQAQLYQQNFDDLGRRQNEAIYSGQTAMNQAAAGRAAEMAVARGQLGDYGNDLRQQSFQRVAAASGLAGQQMDVDKQVLQNSQFNAGQTNTGRQFAASGAYAADSANADRDLQGQGMNQAADLSVQQGNQNASVTTQQGDDRAYEGAAGRVTDAANQGSAQAIGFEQDFSQAFQQTSDRTANFITGNATTAQQAQGRIEADKARKAELERQYVTAGVAAAGTIAGAAVTASDERTKNIRGAAPSADFTRARDYNYTYKPQFQHQRGADSRSHVGPMAQDLPDDLVVWDNGVRKVDTARLAMRLSTAVGQLQRQQGIK